MSEISSSIPFHIARAYASPDQALSPGRRSVLPSPAVAPALRESPKRTPSPIISRLVAARVPGSIDFSATATGAAPAAKPGAALPFYTHPADSNAAATAITLAGGRVLDTTA